MSTLPTTIDAITCKYCGRRLEPTYTQLFNRSIFVGHEECDCEGAKEERRLQEERKANEKRRRADADRRWKYSCAGIQRRYMDAEHPRTDECVEAVKQGRNLYVFGDVGTLKSTLVSSVVKGLVDAGYGVKHTAMRKVLSEIKEGFDTHRNPLPDYYGADVLSLDDLGKEAPGEFALDRLFDVIDERYCRMVPTIITTQYKPGELIERLAKNANRETAKAIVSRLRHGCLLVELDGPDRRRA